MVSHFLILFFIIQQSGASQPDYPMQKKVFLSKKSQKIVKDFSVATKYNKSGKNKHSCNKLLVKSFYVIIDVYLNAGKLYLVEKCYLSFFFKFALLKVHLD